MEHLVTCLWNLNIQNDAYENSKIHKTRIKEFHDKRILRKTFDVGQKILLYNSRLYLFLGKLRSRWSNPFIVKHVYPYGAFDFQNPKNGNVFKSFSNPGQMAYNSVKD